MGGNKKQKKGTSSPAGGYIKRKGQVRKDLDAAFDYKPKKKKNG